MAVSIMAAHGGLTGGLLMCLGSSRSSLYFTFQVVHRCVASIWPISSNCKCIFIKCFVES